MTREIMQDLLKAISIAFFCWLALTIFNQFSGQADGAHERLERFLMYSNMNYPTQLFISSLNKKEKLVLAKELEKNFDQTAEKQYVTPAYQLKFVLKSKDALPLKNKIVDAENADIKMNLCWLGVTVFVFFLVYMLK